MAFLACVDGRYDVAARITPSPMSPTRPTVGRAVDRPRNRSGQVIKLLDHTWSRPAHLRDYAREHLDEAESRSLRGASGGVSDV